MEEKTLRTWGKGNGVQQRTRGWVDRVGRVSLTPMSSWADVVRAFLGRPQEWPWLCPEFRLRCPVMYSCHSPVSFPDERTLTPSCSSPPSPLSGYLPQDITPGLPRGASGKEPACQCRRHKRCRFDPWVKKIPWRRHDKSLAWEIPQTEEPGGLGLQFMGPWRVGQDWSDSAHITFRSLESTKQGWKNTRKFKNIKKKSYFVLLFCLLLKHPTQPDKLVRQYTSPQEKISKSAVSKCWWSVSPIANGMWAEDTAMFFKRNSLKIQIYLTCTVKALRLLWQKSLF